MLDAEFTRVTSVRQLSDGRLLVGDAGENTLSVVDWNTRRTTTIGRQGRGPEEYSSVGSLLALPNDSTILIDMANRRWLLLRGSSIVATLGPDSPALRGGAPTPSGADMRGHVLASRSIRPPGSADFAPGRADSQLVVVVDRSSGATDTVGTLRSRPARITVQGPAERPTSMMVRFNPLSAGESAVLFPDGWVAVARIEPYRVDWISPEGRRIAGAPLPFTPVRLDDDEKRDYLRRIAEQSGREPVSPDRYTDWPATLPPFLVGALLPAPDGRLWIRRAPSAAAPETRYDVIDRRGALSARFVLSEQEHVVGFGPAAAYTIKVDDDGIQRLQRHPLPR